MQLETWVGLLKCNWRWNHTEEMKVHSLQGESACIGPARWSAIATKPWRNVELYWLCAQANQSLLGFPSIKSNCESREVMQKLSRSLIRVVIGPCVPTLGKCHAKVSYYRAHAIWTPLPPPQWHKWEKKIESNELLQCFAMTGRSSQNIMSAFHLYLPIPKDFLICF